MAIAIGTLDGGASTLSDAAPEAAESEGADAESAFDTVAPSDGDGCAGGSTAGGGIVA